MTMKNIIMTEKDDITTPIMKGFRFPFQNGSVQSRRAIMLMVADCRKGRSEGCWSGSSAEKRAYRIVMLTTGEEGERRTSEDK